jgi:hypothetical protein
LGGGGAGVRTAGQELLFREGRQHLGPHGRRVVLRKTNGEAALPPVESAGGGLRNYVAVQIEDQRPVAVAGEFEKGGRGVDIEVTGKAA